MHRAEEMRRIRRLPRLLPSPHAVRIRQTRSRYSHEKAAKMLGFVPRISLEEGMRRTEAWLRYMKFIPSDGPKEPSGA